MPKKVLERIKNRKILMLRPQTRRKIQVQEDVQAKSGDWWMRSKHRRSFSRQPAEAKDQKRVMMIMIQTNLRQMNL